MTALFKPVRRSTRRAGTNSAERRAAPATSSNLELIAFSFQRWFSWDVPASGRAAPPRLGRGVRNGFDTGCGAHYLRFLRASGDEPPPFLEHPDFRAPDQPVVGVDYLQALRYCEWLASESGLAVRLPTEAEREKAARGGIEGAVYPWGDEQAGGGHRTLKGPLAGPDRVRSTPPNGYGLFHMADNVHEWCLDTYIPDYYSQSPKTNPCASGSERQSARGGSWRHAIVVTACAARSSLPPSFHYSDFGFRWVVSE
jgi:formylglycine-generating enzyme required for sulfatase activity